LWQEAHRFTQPSHHFGKGFVIAFFGERLIAVLLDGCLLLGVLTILALGDINAIFGILNVLAFGNLRAFANVHVISSVLTVLDLGVFAQLIIVLCDMVIVASCKQQHESLIVAWEFFVLPSLSSFIVITLCNTT
jgi:hypothetical protein